MLQPNSSFLSDFSKTKENLNQNKKKKNSNIVIHFPLSQINQNNKKIDKKFLYKIVEKENINNKVESQDLIELFFQNIIFDKIFEFLIDEIFTFRLVSKFWNCKIRKYLRYYYKINDKDFIEKNQKIFENSKVKLAIKNSDIFYKIFSAQISSNLQSYLIIFFIWKMNNFIQKIIKIKLKKK